MKLSKLSQLILVSAIGLTLATVLTACQLVSIDYLFVANSAGNAAGSAGQISTYAVDAHSGAIRTIAPTVSSGGTTPVALAIASDETDLYVANQGNTSVVHFAIADNGVLTKKDSVTLAGAPISLAVNAAGTYLYVVSDVLSGTTNSATLTEYALNSGTIGTATATLPLTLPNYTSDVIVPVGVAVLANSSAVYVAAYDKSAYNPAVTTTSNANPGWVFGYAVGSGGALTTVTGSPYQAGVRPSAITNDPTSRFVYVTDYASNQVIGYTVQSNNVLSFMLNGPFKTGNEPSAMVIDPRGIYLYITNALDSTVSAYTIALSTGTPSLVINTIASTSDTTDTQPVAITVETGLGRYVYTANYLGNSVSGFLLNPNTGALSLTQATPYPTGAAPTAVAAVPHGNHAVQVISQ